MPHHTLSDEQFSRIDPLLPGKQGDRGRTAASNKRFLEAVLFVAHNGGRRRDLPERFGKWNSVFVRFNRWSKKGAWERLFESVQEADLEWLMVELTDPARPPGCGAGAKKGDPSDVATAREAFGRSRGGLSTKLHVACDGLGCDGLGCDGLGPGQASDGRAMLPLIDGLSPESVLADAVYDGDEIRAAVAAVGALAVIKPSASRAKKPHFDRELYRERNKAERLIGRLKRYRRLGTRYEQTTRNYLSFVHVVSTLILLA